MKATIENRRKALFARTTSATLVTSLKILEARAASGTVSKAETMVRAWTIAELEERFPAASIAVGDAFEAAENAPGGYVDVDYVAVLLANIEG